MPFAGAAKRNKSPRVETRGRKPKTITQEMRDTVCMLRATGSTNDQIALTLRMDKDTLAKHFYEELNFKYLDEKKLVVAKLKELGMKGNVSALKAYAVYVKDAELDPSIHRPTAKLQEPEPKAEKIGKKDQLNIDAKTASKGTAWQDHLTKQ